MAPPAGFNEAFLAWFQAETEATWASYRPRTFDAYVAGRVGGTDWQTGTRWTRDLDDNAIDAVEHSWGLRFPSDYRLFLRCLHATDRPRTGALYAGAHDIVPATRPGVYDWKHDAAAIAGALEEVVEGLLFDVENNVLWSDEWGPKPATVRERERVVREFVGAAPRLAPIFAHRALVLEPEVPGNPVLSIHQSDIIVYGGDLRSYLLTEFATLLPPGSAPSPGPTGCGNDVRFWLDFG